MKETNYFNTKAELNLKPNPTKLSDELHIKFLKSLIEVRNNLYKIYRIIDPKDNYCEINREFCQDASSLFLRIAGLNLISESLNFEDINIIEVSIKVSRLILSYRAEELWSNDKEAISLLYNFFSDDMNFELTHSEKDLELIYTTQCVKRLTSLAKCIGDLNFLIILLINSPSIKYGDVYVFLANYISSMENKKSILETAQEISSECDELFNKFKPQIEMLLKMPKLAEKVRSIINDDGIYINLLDLGTYTTKEELERVANGEININEYLTILEGRQEEALE